MKIEYNADGQPLGVRGSFEQRPVYRVPDFTRRAFTYAGFITLGIIIGRFVA